MNGKILLPIAGIAVVIGAALALAPGTDPPRQAENVGLVVNTPATSASLQELSGIYSDAAAAGIGRSNVYMFWDAVEPARGEFDWGQPDVLMSFNKNNGLKITLYFSVINGRTLGPFPDWMGNPSLDAIDADRLFGVLDAILSRYAIIDTVIIAGQTESHFRYAEQDIQAYKGTFTKLYDRLKEAHPGVSIGNAFALHHVLNKDLDHIVRELALGDFVGYTYFPVDSLNEISVTPAGAREHLNQSLELASGKPVGFMEVGWSTSEFVGGSSADQEEFVEELMDFYSENESGIEFLVWYRQYDRPTEACVAALAGGAGRDSGLEIAGNQYVVERLGHYICSSGMIQVDGTPKPAWESFQARLGMIN